MEKSATLPQHSPHLIHKLSLNSHTHKLCFSSFFFIFKRLYKNEEAILL